MLSVDARDPHALASWWAEALGWERTYEDDSEVAIELPGHDDPSALREGWGVSAIAFQRVDDARVAKNRLHLDLRPDDRDAEVARLMGLGATRADIGQGDVTWVVLCDPEGNEFCVLGSERSA